MELAAFGPEGSEEGISATFCNPPPPTCTAADFCGLVGIRFREHDIGDCQLRAEKCMRGWKQDLFSPQRQAEGICHPQTGLLPAAVKLCFLLVGSATRQVFKHQGSDSLQQVLRRRLQILCNRGFRVQML